MDTHSLFDLTPVRARRTRRASSYDRSGANLDFRRLPAGASTTLLDVDGPGLITHIWFALGHMDYNYLRQLTIRVTWDDAPGPSVNCPLGDFLGVGHAVSNRYQSALTGMVRGTGRRGESTGGNTWFPMPFRRHARVEVTNESPIPCLACYFMVDWLELEPAAVAEAGYFHAAWRRENPKRVTPTGENDSYILLGRFGRNVSGADNFLVADLRGCGRFVGMNLSIDNLDDRVLGKNVNAYGEGDEMIFIDGEPRPSLHGTGTEDYFLDAWGMTGHANLYAGMKRTGKRRDASLPLFACPRNPAMRPQRRRRCQRRLARQRAAGNDDDFACLMSDGRVRATPPRPQRVYPPLDGCLAAAIMAARFSSGVSRPTWSPVPMM